MESFHILICLKRTKIRMCYDEMSCRHGLYGLPIRFTTYTSPFDINMHDSSNEKERTQMKDHIFVSSIAESNNDTIE